MKNCHFRYSKDRSIYINILFCIISLVGIVVIPSVLTVIFNKYINNSVLCLLLGDLIFIVLLYLMYFKDLNKEAKDYFKDFKKNFKYGFKIYILGYMGMLFCNLIIFVLIGKLSSNEEQVREMLFNQMLYTMITISIIAPLSEEIVFRKSLEPIIKNKWIYVLLCGLLFGGAHILTNVINDSFKLLDLIYILPYGCLGASLALMDYDTKTTFTSIVMHAFHNTITGILLILTYLGTK